MLCVGLSDCDCVRGSEIEIEMCLFVYLFMLKTVKVIKTTKSKSEFREVKRVGVSEYRKDDLLISNFSRTIPQKKCANSHLHKNSQKSFRHHPSTNLNIPIHTSTHPNPLISFLTATNSKNSNYSIVLHIDEKLTPHALYLKSTIKLSLLPTLPKCPPIDTSEPRACPFSILVH